VLALCRFFLLHICEGFLECQLLHIYTTLPLLTTLPPVSHRPCM